MDRSWLKDAQLPDTTDVFRAQVRSFLDRELAQYPLENAALSWGRADVDFSRAMGRAGLIGTTWPSRYGGGERTALERYVLAEELLAVGAPVAAHWTADRQVGPTLLKFGTEEQRQQFLPAICRGEAFFCVGLSEPDAGSDLASVRTRAIAVEGGWRLSGTKLWITQAHLCHFMLALVRTTPGERHRGLSQLVVDLSSPGVTVRPIRDLTGGDHFSEVVFEDVFVPADMLVGVEGDAWRQVMAELSNERSGPERYLSSLPILDAALDRIHAEQVPGSQEQLGALVAELLTLRAMSVGVACTLQRGQDPSIPAALVKDAGSTLEQYVPDLVARLTRANPSPDGPPLERALAVLLGFRTVFSLRGGTREILKGIIARDLAKEQQ